MGWPPVTIIPLYNENKVHPTFRYFGIFTEQPENLIVPFMRRNGLWQEA